MKLYQVIFFIILFVLLSTVPLLALRFFAGCLLGYIIAQVYFDSQTADWTD